MVRDLPDSTILYVDSKAAVILFLRIFPGKIVKKVKDSKEQHSRLHIL
jgi:hypothetical protein